VDRVSRLAVFERDAWVCHICRHPVDRSASVPQPMAATIDHIIPIAGGGDHNYGNVATAHFICNSLKRDTMPQGRGGIDRTGLPAAQYRPAAFLSRCQDPIPDWAPGHG
jgi:5-methylcytosine-specific restriction endonuclease McrA